MSSRDLAWCGLSEGGHRSNRASKPAPPKEEVLTAEIVPTGSVPTAADEEAIYNALSQHGAGTVEGAGVFGDSVVDLTDAAKAVPAEPPTASKPSPPEPPEAAPNIEDDNIIQSLHSWATGLFTPNKMDMHLTRTAQVV